MESVSIREMKFIDSKEISQLLAELGYQIPDFEICKAFDRQNSSSSEQVYVAEFHGEVAGVIACTFINVLHDVKPIGRITTLVVSEKYRGNSIGKELVKRAEQYFMMQHCSKIEVTSNISRHHAHLFYESQGYNDSPKRFTKVLSS